MSKLSPFDFANSINHSKEDLMIDDVAEKAYSPFMVNRALSQFSDTVILANEMNIHHHLDHRLQYDFLLGVVRKKKRFSKWAKHIEPSDLETVKEYYGYSNEKAKSALKLLTKEQIDIIRKKLYKGGR